MHSGLACSMSVWVKKHVRFESNVHGSPFWSIICVPRPASGSYMVGPMKRFGRLCPS